MGFVDGQVAIATGAASGIGRAAAEIFAREGARVLIADTDEDGLAETASSLEAVGAEVLALPTDVADEASVARMVAAAVERWGRIDCAFNNAGVSDTTAAFEDVSLDAWNRMIAVNLTGVFLCMQHEVRQMKRQEPIDGMRGAICNTSSGAGVIAAPGLPHYTAAKHGVLGLTKVAAQELFGAGIRVNAVCPGMTESKMTAAFVAEDNEITRSIMKTLPGGRMGKPEEVAEAAVWLCSPLARFVSGDSMLVDGSMVSR